MLSHLTIPGNTDPRTDSVPTYLFVKLLHKPFEHWPEFRRFHRIQYLPHLRIRLVDDASEAVKLARAEILTAQPEMAGVPG